MKRSVALAAAPEATLIEANRALTTERSARRPSPSASAVPELPLPYLLKVADVAELLRTSPKAVYSRIERGLLPGVVRDGRRVLILRDDLLQWIAERRATSPGGPRRCP